MKIRIAKFIADSGITSRRGAEQMIADGRVMVNGETIKTPVHFVNDSDEIVLDGKKIEKRNDTKVYAFHKPIDTVTTTRDPRGRNTIYDILPREYRNLKYIGRLDYKTTGLLLMTNDGILARKLTLPNSNIPRVYLADVAGNNMSKLDRARNGVTIDGITYRPMKIEIMPDKRLRVTVTEGKKNEIRIVLRHCGLPVRKLHRIMYGPVSIKNIPSGKIIELDEKTIDALVKTSL
ncbi:MAG: rRNA pseudouridine synthase [Alphaproteobacteria bacterium]|nr:rRNA pseudouridine synthase [Alphaproteobacteria bacterium]